MIIALTSTITLPVDRVDGGFRYTDLKLDLWWQGGDCGIVDQDDPQEALHAGDLDSTTAARAEVMADDLQVRLERDQEFVQSGFDLLARMLGDAGLMP
jgi:predicted RNA-binding protein associated with RNAse of E/G family